MHGEVSFEHCLTLGVMRNIDLQQVFSVSADSLSLTATFREAHC